MKIAHGTTASSVIAHHQPTAAASEAFRVLRTNLQFMSLDQPLKSILITSATPNEGKSTTAANLAVAFAQTGASVCLVDADLRKPVVSKLFGLENWAGLTTTLIGRGELDYTVMETQVPGLMVLPSGPIPPNPAELVGSQRMITVLEQLQARFDMVIIDTPPLLAVTDAATVSPHVGGVLLVVRAKQVDRHQVARAKEALDAVKARILGVVLGAVEQDSSSGYYYYGYESKDRGRKAT